LGDVLLPKEFRFVLFFLTVLFSAPPVAMAASYAVLVGVSDYDERIGLSDLRGPANDVRLLRDVFETRGDFDIRILADGVNGGIDPSRENILAALDDVVERSEPGDFVYLHFSGHGTQQGDLNGDESDGMDEVFLPRDTARAEPGTTVIPNAIVDEEFGERVLAMRTKGVDVWFVLDSCHSGSGLRAGSPRIATRFVDPAALGVSLPAATTAVASPLIDAAGDENLPGKYLAFYAAQSSEVAREIQIDEADPDSWYGLFSSRLAARLQTGANQSYRQLFQALLGDLDDSAIPGAARLQTPLWEGNLIDAPVFGGGDVIGVRQFAVDGARIRAGKLQGLRDNTVVALVADAAAAADDILGYAQLRQTGAQSATFVAVNGSCVASVAKACDELGPTPANARFARIVAQPLDDRIRIAPPQDLESGEVLPADHPLYAALTTAVATSNADQATNIVLEPDASVLTAVMDDALWFGARLAIGDSPVGLAWRPGDGPLDQLLLRIVKAEQVAEMLGSVAGTQSVLFPSPVEFEVMQLASDASQLNQNTPTDLVAECMAALGSAAPVPDFGTGAQLKQCDYLVFEARGVVQGPARDVNRVYIDSQFCVSAEYQRIEGIARPALIGEPMTVCSDCPEASGFVQKAGAERMFFVVTEAEDNREALNLEGAIDNCAGPGTPTRSGAAQTVSGFLSGLSERDATRGGMGNIGISKIWVEQYNWDVLPRSAALAIFGQN